jgi:hypothetical protein
VLAREKIAMVQLDVSYREGLGDSRQSAQIAGRPDEASDVREALMQQPGYDM